MNAVRVDDLLATKDNNLFGVMLSCARVIPCTFSVDHDRQGAA